MDEQEKDELRRREAVLQVMNIKFKNTPYNPQSTNQERKRKKLEDEIKSIKKEK